MQTLTTKELIKCLKGLDKNKHIYITLDGISYPISYLKGDSEHNFIIIENIETGGK